MSYLCWLAFDLEHPDKGKICPRHTYTHNNRNNKKVGQENLSYISYITNHAGESAQHILFSQCLSCVRFKIQLKNRMMCTRLTLNCWHIFRTYCPTKWVFSTERWKDHWNRKWTISSEKSAAALLRSAQEMCLCHPSTWSSPRESSTLRCDPMTSGSSPIHAQVSFAHLKSFLCNHAASFGCK